MVSFFDCIIIKTQAQKCYSGKGNIDNQRFVTIISSVLKKCFDGFCVDGAIHVDTIGTILSMMGLRVKPSALKEIVKEIDADGSGQVSGFNNIKFMFYINIIFINHK